MFWDPLYAAAYKNHIAIAKILMVDDAAGDTIYKRAREMARFAMFNDQPKVLDIALDSSWHNDSITPDGLQEIRFLALCVTSNPETLQQLLLDVKPYLATRIPEQHRPSESEAVAEMLNSSLQFAAMYGDIELANYLLEQESVSVNLCANADYSLFKSRHPAVLENFKSNLHRAWSVVSEATHYRQVDMVKMLLNAGAKPGNAIEYAAAIGSREGQDVLGAWIERR
jgi:ankyrin repeat protein